MARCKYCDFPLEKGRCPTCEFTLYMLEEAVKSYLNENPPPNWLIGGLRELYWIFLSNPLTAGYINTAVEIVETFVFDDETQLNDNDIKEMNYSVLSSSKIKSVLEDARIIEIVNDVIVPGPITKKLQQKRWEGFESGSSVFENSLKEMHAILSISILRSLLYNENRFPRSAYSVFTMLSSHVIQNFNEQHIPYRIQEASWNSAFITLPTRQKNKLIRKMIGLYDGSSKIIIDYTEDNELELKESIVSYLENMRVRYRSRDRDERVRDSI